MSQWAGGPGQPQPGFQYPMQTGFPGQQQPQFAQQPQQQFGQPQQQQQFGQPQQLGYGGGGLAPQPTGFPAMRAQPTGFPGSGFAPQPTGFSAGMGRAMPPPPVPPVPAQFQQQQPAYRAPPPPPPPQSQFITGAQPSFLNTQPTGFAGGMPNRLLSQPTGMTPLVAQPTGFMDPRLTLMANNLLPGANYGAGLQQSFAQQTQERGKPKLSWALSKAEKKNYDQIFRAWDPRGTGFITGETALEVFGQSGLDKNDLARIWTLADTDNRGKLNVAEFHVAMGLIYRSLNGLPIPDQLPPELKPPSARDTEEAVDFLKSVLKNDNHTRSTNSVEPGGPMSYAKTRSFNEQQGAGGGGRKDATVYKYDNDSEGRKVYKSSARHLDRDSVKTGHETASEDLEDLKRQLENSSRALENATLAEASRSREDEELERELDELKRRVKRVKDDLDYVSRGPRSEKRDEDRRELEREMTYLLHERIPQVQKKIEERDRRKERERREWAKDRDYRNDRFGRFDDGGRASPSSSSYRRDDRDTGYLRGTYDRDDRDRSSRDYDRDRDREYDRYRDRDGDRRESDRPRDYDRSRDYDRDRDNRSRGGVDRDRDREREPERARTPQAAAAPRSTTPGGLSAPPPSRAAAASPAPSTKNMTPEERQAYIRAEAQRRTQERMVKLGLAAPPSAGSTPVDTDVEQRLARERKEAEEKARKAELELEEREKARNARLLEARGESATPAPAPPAPAPAPAAGAKKPPAPPPPKKRAPVPPPSRAPAPPAPAPVPAAAAAPPPPPPPAAEPEEDPEEKRLRERREALRRQREELEREEREQEERRKRLEEQRKAAQAPAPAAVPTSPPVVPAAPPAPPPPAAPAAGGHNPFRPRGAPAAVVSPATSTASGSTNPFFAANPNANGAPAVSPAAAAPPAPVPEAAAPPPPPPPPPAPEQPRFAPPPAFIPPPPKGSYNTAPSDDESWDEIKEKESDDDSSDDEFADRKRRENIAQALFGGILPSSPAPPVRPQSAAATSKPNTPAPASFAPPPPPAAPDAPPPPPAPPAPQAPAAPPPPPAAPMAPPPPPAAAGGLPAAPPAGMGALLGDIRSGTRLRKAVTNDRSTAAVGGRVIGDAAPPPHVSAQPRPASPPSPPPPAFVPPPPPAPPEDAAYASTARSDNRQSVDWYAGLAAHSMGAEHAAVASAIAALPETKEEDEYAPDAANGHANAVPDIRVDDFPAPAAEEDPLDDIDMNTEYRALSLYPYDAQRPEELSFVQNMILTVYPSKSGSEWWYGRSVSSGSKGFIPKTYIKTVEPNATLRAHAIYPWEATNADELSLAEGDVLTVIDRTDPDWWKVEKDGLVRVVPASYMEPVDGTAGSPKSPTLRPEIITNPKQGDVIRPTLEVAVKNAEPSKGSGQDSPINPTSPRDSESGSATSSDYVSLSDDESADDWSSDESDNGHKTEEQIKQERVAREQERQRVLEAAGLIIKPSTDAPPLTRVRSLRKRRAPPPPPPASSTVHPPAIVPEEEEDVPPPVPPKSPTGASFTLDDAYERYQQYQQTNAATKRNNRLSVSSVEMPPSPSLSPSLSLSWSPSRGAEAPPESRYGAIFALFGRSKTPGAEESQAQKPRPIISAPILGPVGTPSRESSPAFGSSWASLVDKSALEDMPKNERRRQEAIFELIATESAYVRDLQLIVETFYASMLPMLDEKAVKVIFANMEDILLTNTTFLSMLEERQKESRLYIVSVGDILEQQLSLMGVYMKYCVNHSNAIKTLQALRSANPQLNAHLNHLRDQPQLRNLDLSSFLLIPMQRITRYPLLIRQIIHYTEPGKEHMLLQSALRTSEEILESINESIREQENEQRLSALSRDLWVGQGRLDLTAPTRFLGPRKLLKEGELFKAKSKRRLHAVLCNDVLVLMDAGAQSLYRMPLPLHEVKVGEVPGRRDDCTFQVSLAGRRGSDAIGLRAASPRECQAWMKAVESAAQKCAHAEKRGPRLSLSM